LVLGYKKKGKFVPTEKKKKGISIDDITKVEGLDMENKKQREFVTKLKMRLQTDANKLKNVKEIQIEDKRVGEALAEKVPVGDGQDKLIFRYSNNMSNKEIDGLVEHEVDHLDWDDLEENHPEKIRNFMLAVIDEPPFTKDLEDIMKDMQKENDPIKLDELQRKYFDEYDSEIGQVLKRIKSGTQTREQVEQRVNLEKVTMAFNELHS